MAIGAQNESIIGPAILPAPIINNGGLATFAMAATTAAWAARFKARVAKKPKSIVLQWTSVATPGTVQLGVETIDAATGKPNAARTLYDANATFDLSAGSSPALAAGILTCTFASLPSANVAVGTEYAVTLRTSVAGTTQTLGSHIGTGAYPSIVLTSTDSGTTWAEIANAVPACVIIWDDDTCEEIGFSPYGNTITVLPLYSTVLGGQKIVTNNGNVIAGVYGSLGKIGTPVGDLRCRIFDSVGNAVSGASVTVDKDSLTGMSLRRSLFLFPTPISLVAGTYRVIFDSAASADSSNCWNVRTITFLHSAAVPVSYRSCTASDGSADSTTQIAAVALVIDSQTAGGGNNNSLWGSIR